MVYIAIENFNSDSNKTDNRGKHNNRPHRMPPLTEENIKSHIKLFPIKDGHYVRKTSQRKYLSENLNISKMYRLYTDWFQKENIENVIMGTKRQYETVFNTQFNYSFFTPKKDLCATCVLYEQAEGTRKESLEGNF